jgi:hypothetical protein
MLCNDANLLPKHLKIGKDCLEEVLALLGLISTKKDINRVFL